MDSVATNLHQSELNPNVPKASLHGELPSSQAILHSGNPAALRYDGRRWLSGFRSLLRLLFLGLARLLLLRRGTVPILLLRPLLLGPLISGPARLVVLLRRFVGEVGEGVLGL